MLKIQKMHDKVSSFFLIFKVFVFLFLINVE